jgi:sarcosine oxidase subunit alpha
VWEAVMKAGEPFAITPYGTEAMHVLRAEKGYVIVGQDTDGTVTPDDLGMSWIVRKDGSDFVGRRSLSRRDTVRADRKQLVGLVPTDGTTLLPEGAHVVASVPRRDPASSDGSALGHVTSSYRSPSIGPGPGPGEAQGTPFALAMVRSGRSLVGGTVHAALLGGPVACDVVEPVFWDPGDARRDG